MPIMDEGESYRLYLQQKSGYLTHRPKKGADFWKMLNETPVYKPFPQHYHQPYPRSPWKPSPWPFPHSPRDRDKDYISKARTLIVDSHALPRGCTLTVWPETENGPLRVDIVHEKLAAPVSARVEYDRSVSLTLWDHRVWRISTYVSRTRILVVFRSTMFFELPDEEYY